MGEVDVVGGCWILEDARFWKVLTWRVLTWRVLTWRVLDVEDADLEDVLYGSDGAGDAGGGDGTDGSDEADEGGGGNDGGEHTRERIRCATNTGPVQHITIAIATTTANTFTTTHHT
jgi:hypothetical protein